MVSKLRAPGYAGFSTFKDGMLLQQANGNFDVLLTPEKSMKYQNNFVDKKSGERMVISLLVVRSKSAKLADILQHITAIVDALRHIVPGQIIYVGHGATIHEAKRSARRQV